MDERNGEITVNEVPVFQAELTPYRSLGRRGYTVFFAIAGALTAIHLFIFFGLGAWPIMVFFGLDFLLLYGAFWLSYRSARAREEVSLSRTDLSIRKISPAGRITEHRFVPFWTRFNVNRHTEIGIVSMWVSGQGRSTDIGSFLNADDRESFAKAFSGALATVKR
ncbi:DUF2244 domain-containing protein [Rhizobium sp. SG2393]|uniref:DUF2244 domain-containing protein n=1 Tax=Rhizobium sp. SG2393 TaxID=3276279 RepID=UPI003670BF18